MSTSMHHNSVHLLAPPRCARDSSCEWLAFAGSQPYPGVPKALKVPKAEIRLIMCDKSVFFGLYLSRRLPHLGYIDSLEVLRVRLHFLPRLLLFLLESVGLSLFDGCLGEIAGRKDVFGFLPQRKYFRIHLPQLSCKSVLLHSR